MKKPPNITLAMVCIIVTPPTIICALKQINTIYPKINELLNNLNFKVANHNCNSLYLYTMSVNIQVTWVTTHHIYNAIHYNSIII
jgi:hypothetical protein